MSFLPLTYDVPSSTGNYFKFQDGANKVRIMSQPILGWRFWITDEEGKKNEQNGCNCNYDPFSGRFKNVFYLFSSYIKHCCNDDKYNIFSKGLPVGEMYSIAKATAV